MIVAFDLDDTLYEEITYVKSSFKAVATYLHKKYGFDENLLYAEMLSILDTDGRGSVFNKVLIQFGIFSKSEVKKCLSVYRNNTPEIFLPQVSIDCLNRLGDFPKYLVTDGNKMVQSNKIKSLKLEPYFKRLLPTHFFGKDKSKPSTYVFHKILQWEKSTPEKLIYIGDNPNKDFVNLRKEGFKTIRVLTGMFKNLKRENEFEADVQINSLEELNAQMIVEILNK